MQVETGVHEDGTPEDPELARLVEEEDAKASESDSASGGLSDIGSILGVGADGSSPGHFNRRSGRRSSARDNGHVEEEAPAPDVEEVLEETAEEEEETVRNRRFGGEVPEAMAALFTPQGFGNIMARGTSAFYESCEADPLDRSEMAISEQAWAYYAQSRFPEDWSKWQPELILAAAIIIPLASRRRMEKVAVKTKPMFADLWRFVSFPFRWLFRRKKTEESNVPKP